MSILLTTLAIITLFLKPSSVTFKVLSLIVALLGGFLAIDYFVSGNVIGTILHVLIAIVWMANVFRAKSDEPIAKVSMSIEKGER